MYLVIGGVTLHMAIDTWPCACDKHYTGHVLVINTTRGHVHVIKHCANITQHCCADDFSRVKLEPIEGEDNSDYINASFIDVS